MDVTSTPLRKSNKKRFSQEQLPQVTPINHVQEDESERRNRRSVAIMQKRLSAIPSQGSPNLNSSMNAYVDVEEVKKHFKECQKLLVENKINNKNAWNLKLIDYFNVLVSQDLFGKDFMLIAATSLDICTKVYACRVDDLYEKGLQLTSTITSLDKQQVVEGERNDEGDAEEGEGEKRQTKKKKKTRRLSANQKHTIAKDLKTIEQPNIPKMQSVFFVGHTNIDASNNENLFTNKLPMDHVGYKMMLLDKVNQGMPHYDEQDPSVEQDHMTSLKINPGAFKICRAFAGFHIDEWNPDQEEAQIAEIDKAQKTIALANDELVYDEEGIPIAELDGSIHDIFTDERADDDMLEEPQEEVNTEAATNQEEEFISSFCPIDNNHFVNNDLDPWWMRRVWIGPSHWKNKFIKQRSGRFTGKIVNQAPPKTRRKINPVSVEINFSDYTPLDMMKKYKSSKKVKYDTDKITLPLNYLPLAPDYRMLLTKPFVSQRELPPVANEEEYEHSPYDYDNPNDSQYCSQHGIPDELDDNNEPPPENDMVHEEEQVANCEMDRGNMTADLLPNLVEAPEMVEQMYIPYALRAKKMNMKRLKNTMWEILTEDQSSNIVVNIEERPAKKMKLSHLYVTLPSRLPQSMKTELSPHLAFIALLHLANQHNLKITGQADLFDLKIEQDKKK